MCTGERTRELHSGPARAGGGLTRRESLASSTANAGIVSKCNGRHNPADHCAWDRVFWSGNWWGSCRGWPSGGPVNCCSRNRPLLSTPAQPSVAPRNTADDQRQSPWFCTANALICFTKPFYPCAQTRLSARPFFEFAHRGDAAHMMQTDHLCCLCS